MSSHFAAILQCLWMLSLTGGCMEAAKVSKATYRDLVNDSSIILSEDACRAFLAIVDSPPTGWLGEVERTVPTAPLGQFFVERPGAAPTAYSYYGSFVKMPRAPPKEEPAWSNAMFDTWHDRLRERHYRADSSVFVVSKKMETE
jgi:hypothetical protein